MNTLCDGIAGYLTNGYYKNDKFDKDAIISTFIPFYTKNKDNY